MSYQPVVTVPWQPRIMRVLNSKVCRRARVLSKLDVIAHFRLLVFPTYKGPLPPCKQRSTFFSAIPCSALDTPSALPGSALQKPGASVPFSSCVQPALHMWAQLAMDGTQLREQLFTQHTHSLGTESSRGLKATERCAGSVQTLYLGDWDL